jgi:hypothetical protein
MASSLLRKKQGEKLSAKAWREILFADACLTNSKKNDLQNMLNIAEEE